jgi:protein-L-isoaspartate(D-aspartate) O-methyltransferase
MRSWFIPCAGAAEAGNAALLPTRETAAKIRSLWPRTGREPDGSAVAIFDDVWFSSEPIV